MMAVQTVDLIENPSDYASQLTYNADDGSTSMSMRAVARICGVDDSSIRHLLRELDKLITGCGKVTHKIAQSLYQQGFQVRDESGSIPDEMAHAILSLYAAQPSRQLARKNLSFFALLGIRARNLQMLGQVVVNAEPVTQELAPNPFDSLCETLVNRGASTDKAQMMYDLAKANGDLALFFNSYNPDV